MSPFLSCLCLCLQHARCWEGGPVEALPALDLGCWTQPCSSFPLEKEIRSPMWFGTESGVHSVELLVSGPTRAPFSEMSPPSSAGVSGISSQINCLSLLLFRDPQCRPIMSLAGMEYWDLPPSDGCECLLPHSFSKWRRKCS